jgi:multidrug efflux pump subunit AcrA (membrane-fusion protein)
MRISTTDSLTPPSEPPSGPLRSKARRSSAGRRIAGIARERASPLRIAGVSIAVAAISAGLAWAVTHAARDGAALATAPERRVVRVAPVGVIEEAHELRFPGTMRAVRRANLSFVVGGRLSERAVDLGDRVERGAPLARLDPQPFLNEVRSAEAVVAEVGARLEQISRDRHRLTRLRAGGVASEQELERTSSSQDQLRASSAVHREPGEFVQEGAAVLAISGDDGFEIEVEVPESVASTLVEGQAATVSFPLAGVPAAPAWLKSVSRGTEGPGRLFPIVAQLQPTPGVIPGMAGELIVRASRGSHLAVPLASIIDPSGKHPYVFRVADGRAERVPVEVRTLVGERITVVGALQAGDRVVVAGHAVLLDGDPVEVR